MTEENAGWGAPRIHGELLMSLCCAAPAETWFPYRRWRPSRNVTDLSSRLIGLGMPIGLVESSGRLTSLIKIFSQGGSSPTGTISTNGRARGATR
jgi:hypothetical protein